jgi:hypothetical protein
MLMQQAFMEVSKLNFVRKLCIACLVFIWPDNELNYTYQYIFDLDSSRLTRVSRFFWLFALQLTIVFSAIIGCYAIDKMQKHYHQKRMNEQVLRELQEIIQDQEKQNARL